MQPAQWLTWSHGMRVLSHPPNTIMIIMGAPDDRLAAPDLLQERYMCTQKTKPRETEQNETDHQPTNER